jgi:hypothetical protein
MLEALRALSGSRKAIVVLGIFIGLSVLVGIGRVPPEYLKEFLSTVVPAWLGAHAVEESVKAYRGTGGKQEAPAAAPAVAPPAEG